MKKTIIATILFISASISFSQDRTLIYKEDRTITVYGDGIVDTLSNVAYLSYSVKGFGSKFKDAVAAATKKNEEIVGKLVSFGLSKKNIQSSSFYSGQNYSYKPLFSKSKDYQASLSVVVNIDSLKILDNLIIMISEQDIENMSNVTFSLTDLSRVQAIARDKAIDNAKQQASEISQKCNVKLGKLLSYSELDGSNQTSMDYDLSQIRKRSEVVGYFDNPTPVYCFDNAEVQDRTTASFSANRLKISKRIKAIYEISE